MMQSKQLVDGMTAPAIEPILIHTVERKRGPPMSTSAQEPAFAPLAAWPTLSNASKSRRSNSCEERRL